MNIQNTNSSKEYKNHYNNLNNNYKDKDKDVDMDMDNNTYKISFKITGHPPRISVYIDRYWIDAIGFYPVNEYGYRMSEEEMESLKPDFVIDRAELEVRDIKSIALAMDKKTFNSFCELWEKIHDSR